VGVRRLEPRRRPHHVTADTTDSTIDNIIATIEPTPTPTSTPVALTLTIRPTIDVDLCGSEDNMESLAASRHDMLDP
jgi:hypothetical protein